MVGLFIAIQEKGSLLLCVLRLWRNVQQHIARGNLARLAGDSSKLGGVSNYHRGNQVIAFGADKFRVKGNQFIACGNALLLFHMDFKTFASQLHGVETYVNE